MGSPKGQQKSTSSQTMRPDQYAYDLYKNILERAEQIGQQPYTAYRGEQVAGFTPDQLAAFQAIREAQGAGAGTLQQGVEAAGRGVAAITPEDIQRYQDPYQQAVVASTLSRMREQAEEDVSGLKGKQIMAGAFGGDRARVAEAALRSEQAEQRDRVVADLMSKGYSQSLAAAQADRMAAAQGAGQLGSLASMEFAQPLAQAQALGGIGTAQQQLEQQYLNVPYQQFLEERAYPYQQLQWLAGLGTGVGSQMGTTQEGVQTQTPAKPSLFSQILGAGLSLAALPVGGPALAGAAGAAGSLGGNFLSSLSDERLKENIEDVGVTHDGQTIYKYNYKGDPKTHIGLLAQEVEQVHPESVGQVAGFKVVNYDTATKDAVRKADGGPVMPYGGTGIPTPMAYPGAPNISPLRFMEPQETQDETQQLVSKAVKLAKSIKEGMNKPTTEGWEATVTPTAPVEPVTREPLPPVRMPEPESVRPMDYTMPESASMTMAESPFSYYMPKADGGEVEKSSSLLEKATGLELSDAARQGLLAAGLGMLSSRSPFAGTAIGEGGLKGLGVYQSLKAGEQEAEQERQRLEQKTEMEKSRLEFQQKAAEERQKLAEQRLAQAEQYRQKRLAQANLIKTGYTLEDGTPVFIDTNRPGFLYSALDSTPLPPGVKLKSATKKPLPLNVIKELGEAGESLYKTKELIETFKDSYGGFKSSVIGDLANAYARNLANPENAEDREAIERAAWWQNYQRKANIVRNSLFGSALTANESAEWRKADINTGMSPQAIKNNLQIQADAEKRAARKIAKTYAAQGENPEVIASSMDLTMEQLRDLTTGPVLRSDEETKAILEEARNAIASGKPRDLIIKRLLENNIKPEGL